MNQELARALREEMGADWDIELASRLAIAPTGRNIELAFRMIRAGLAAGLVVLPERTK